MSVALRLDYQPVTGAAEELWCDVCAVESIPVNCGAPALITGRQVALVRVDARPGEQEIYALSNFDPFSQAFVIARGIVGDRGGCPKIASPIYKQNFDLRTGVCFDDPSVVLVTYRVRVRKGRIEVAVPEGHGGSRDVSGESGPDIGSAR